MPPTLFFLSFVLIETDLEIPSSNYKKRAIFILNMALFYFAMLDGSE